MTESKHPRLLRWPEVKTRTGICRSHAHYLSAKGEFPQPIKIGIRASAWVANEIDDWVAIKIAESRGGAS